MEKVSNNLYYVELDCLLDTRLGSVACYDKSLSAKLAVNADYHLRPHNQLSLIDSTLTEDQYRELWDNRHLMNTLENSRLTKFAYRLRELIGATKISHAFIPFKQTGSVFVDIHGWGLDVEEQAVLLETMKAFLITENVVLVEIGNEGLDPLTIRRRFTSVSIIDFDLWLNTHIDSLKENRIPSVGFHAPAVMLNPKDLGMLEMYDKGLVQDGARESLATSLRLRYYYPGDFSIVDLT